MFQYLNNIELEEALEFIKNSIIEKNITLSIENAAVSTALNRVSSEAVYAKMSSPHFNACAMDGIAVKASDTYDATETTPVLLSQTQYQMVDTGDPLPTGFDSVIMIEDIIKKGADVALYKSSSPFQHIRQVGEDICEGDMLLPSYTKITPYHIGALLAGGVQQLNILKKPRVAIIPTGDELIPFHKKPQNGELLEFNSQIFNALLSENGCETLLYDIVRDSKNDIKTALLRAANESDLVIINAGSSAGRDDYTKAVIEECGTLLFHGIAIKPGKPTMVGFVGQKIVVGVPGYPVSAALVIEKIVFPILKLLQNTIVNEKIQLTATISKSVVSDLKYRELLRVKVGKIGEHYVAVPLARGAGVITSLSKADGLVEIPQNSEGLMSGQAVSVSLYKPKTEIDNTLLVCGSHDPMVDVIGDYLRKTGKGFYLSSSHTGSTGGIMAIKNNEAHIAPIHLLSTEKNIYNLPYIERFFEKDETVLIKGVKRTQGLMVQKGNPLNLKGIEDLKRENLRYVNRQRGSGTRILLDFLLKEQNIGPENIYGYYNEEYTHSAVAAAILVNNADCGLGIYSAAKLYNLDFLPICHEEYDFLIRKEMLPLPMVKEFLDILQKDLFREDIVALGGYSF